MSQQLLEKVQIRWPWISDRTVWLVSALVFINFAMTAIATTFVGSIFLTAYGAHHLPYLYVAQALAIMLISLTTSTISARYPRAFIVYGHVAAVIVIVIGQWLMHVPVSWLPFVVCIILWAIAQLHSINTGNFAALVFNIRKFKEYNTIFTSVGTLMGAVFAMLLPFYIKGIGVDYLPLLMLALLIIGLPIFHFMQMHQTMRESGKK